MGWCQGQGYVDHEPQQVTWPQSWLPLCQPRMLVFKQPPRPSAKAVATNPPLEAPVALHLFRR